MDCCQIVAEFDEVDDENIDSVKQMPYINNNNIAVDKAVDVILTRGKRLLTRYLTGQKTLYVNVCMFYATLMELESCLIFFLCLYVPILR